MSDTDHMMLPFGDKPSGRRKIYVCSPYRPISESEESRRTELEANTQSARKACRILMTVGYLPLAPHLYFTQFLKDELDVDRQIGLAFAMDWLEQADEVWVFGSRISDGMAQEIAKANELGKVVRSLPEPTRLVELLVKELSNKENHFDAQQDAAESEDSHEEE